MLRFRVSYGGCSGMGIYVHWMVRFSALESVRHDYGIQFLARELQATVAEAGILCTTLPHARFMGVGERYHGVLRHIFKQLSQAHPELDGEPCWVRGDDE